ncbi:MAG: hypothetical protein ABI193_07585 [Minicystis sp.]
MAVGALLALCVGMVGCDKTSAGSGAGPTGTAAGAKDLPVKGPWEAIKLTMVKKDPDGTAHFRVDNVGAKTVTQIYIDIYGYDAKGKQVIHKDLGFSRSIKGGASDDFTRSPEKDVETWEAVYHGIGFEGDAKETMDYKRAPAQRAKGAP